MAFAPIFQRPFSATFDRRAAAAGNGLLNALIAYWPGNEASGDLLDAHTNALTLTDTNTVTNAVGKVYATARQYTFALSEYHVRPGDDALLSTGDVDFTLAAWVYLDNKASQRHIIGKYNSDAGQREFLMQYVGDATDRFRFAVSSDGTFSLGSTGQLVVANNLGAVSTGTWYLIVAWHDAANNQIGISGNNGTADTAAWSAGVLDGLSRFTIGAVQTTAGAANHWDGRIGPVAMWKSAAGGGGVLTAAQRTALYNGGAGLAYAQFTT